MKLRGQHGYAMAALLVALSVMAVLATAVMPVWKQMATREKEAELVFRGEQYVRAIRLFTRRAGPGVLPPNVDVLVQQRYLRKKYKDPITGLDFDLLSPVQAGASAPGAGTPAPTPQAGRGGQGAVLGQQPAIGFGAAAAGGIMGVASKSKDASLRLYNGRAHYNEWQFVYVQQVQQPGGPGGGRGQPQRGQPPPGGIPGVGRPGGPGQRGAGFPSGGFPPPGSRSGGPPGPTGRGPGGVQPPQR